MILQFSADSVVDFDPLVALETKLIEELGEIADVDGHDFGMGNFNIFVLTDEPTGAFTQAHHVILDEGIRNELRSAYRETNGEDYVVLWPPQRRDFEL